MLHCRSVGTVFKPRLNKCVVKWIPYQSPYLVNGTLTSSSNKGETKKTFSYKCYNLVTNVVI